MIEEKSIHVAYSYEHGDETLPRLKELISEIPDPKKDMILNYLRTNCVMVSPGIRYDEIKPGEIIGCGDTFSDGMYYWNDVFVNYIERYNIPVPEPFREHILQNYTERMKRHTLLRLVNCVELEYAPSMTLGFSVKIHRNGKIEYKCSATDQITEVFHISHKDAEYIIDPIMTKLFCYDRGNHGQPIDGGYHWKITFKKYNRIIDIKEGWDGEDSWRRNEIYRILSFVERFIPFDLGSGYMKLLEE